MNDFFDEILLEWSYRVPNGIPNPKNSYHLYLLRGVLEEMDVEPETINEIVLTMKRGKAQEFLHEEKGKLIPGPDTEAGTKRFYYTDSRNELHLVTKPYAEKERFNPASKKDVNTKKTAEEKPEEEKPEEKLKDKDIVSKKDKSLKQVNTLKSEVFNEPIKPPDDEFSKINQKYYNDVPPPRLKLDSLKKKSKVPKQYIDLLERLANTKITNDTKKLVHFYNRKGGAGEIISQSGELVSLIFTMLDEENFNSVYEKLSDHVKKTGDQILRDSWIKAAAENRKAIYRQILNKFPKGTKIVAGAWDNEQDVEALGISDFKKNKGFSTDVYYKLELPDGENKLYEVSLKKAIKAYLINSSAGSFLTWKPDLPDSINVNKYSDKEKEIVVTGSTKVEKSIRELESKLKKEVEDGKIKLPDKVPKNASTYIRFLDAQRRKNYTFDEALEKIHNKEITVSEKRSSLEIIYLGLKTLAESGNKKAQEVIDEHHKIYLKFQHNCIKALSEDPDLKNGLLKSIKEEFPLKSLMEKEENMALGEFSLDSVVLKEIFGTGDFNKIKEQLITAIDKKGQPYLAYRAKVNIGEGEKIIPIATIVIRENGVGYAGKDIKLEMQLHTDFKNRIKKANTKIYGEEK